MKRLLIADDEEFIRKLFQKVLQDPSIQKLGVEIHTAANGREVLAEAEKVPFDLITLDISMPVMNGIDAAREIRASPQLYGKPKIIAVTGVGEKHDAIRAGCDDYLAKPVTNKELLETVLAYLDPTSRKLSTADPQGQLVLIIDKNHGSLYWTQKSLRQAGFHPVLAEGFTDATRICRRGAVPNAVILDGDLLDLVTKEAEDLLSEVRRSSIPVIVRSPAGEPKSEGLWGSFIKARIAPDAKPEELLEKVSGLLG